MVDNAVLCIELAQLMADGLFIVSDDAMGVGTSGHLWLKKL